jgi:hypothetical protein
MALWGGALPADDRMDAIPDGAELIIAALNVLSEIRGMLEAVPQPRD